MSRRGRPRKSVQKAIRCLFCTEPCLPTFGGVQEQPVKKRRTAAKGDESAQKVTSSEKEEWYSLTTQLKNMFVLKNILEIGEEKLSKFLGHLGGQLNPDNWFQTCEYCGEAVNVCYETTKEISRLKRKFVTVTEELKGKILETRGNETGGGSGGKHEEDEVVSSIWDEIREDVFHGEIDLAADDDDYDDDVEDEDESFNKISINSNIFMDEEEEDEIDEFLKGLPPTPDDVELSKNCNPPPLEEKRQKEGRKQKVSTRPSASEDNIEFKYIIHVPIKKETEFKTYTKRRKGRPCYKCLGCPYFETTELKKIREHVKKHRRRRRPASSVASDNVDDNKDSVKSENQVQMVSKIEPVDNNSNSGSDDEIEDSGHGEAGIFISGDIFEDENEDEQSDIEMEVEDENEQIQIKTEMPSPTTATSKSPDDGRKGRKQKLLPIASSDIQLIPPPVMKETPKYTTIRNEKRTYYQCCECPAFLLEWRLMFEHMNLHRPGSSSITCPTPNCGWALDPELVKRHAALKHRPTKPPPPLQPKDGEMSLRTLRSKYYRCEECRALFMGINRLRAHYEVHDNGMGQTCQECGWLCTNLSNHNSFWHPREGGKHAEMRLRTSERMIITVRRNDLRLRRKGRLGRGMSTKLKPDPVGFP